MWPIAVKFHRSGGLRYALAEVGDPAADVPSLVRAVTGGDNDENEDEGGSGGGGGGGGDKGSPPRGGALVTDEDGGEAVRLPCNDPAPPSRDERDRTG